MHGLAGTPLDEEWNALLAAARAGCQSALGEVFERLKRVLRRLAGVYLDPELHVKVSESDLLQETFLEAFRDFLQFGGRTREDLLAWLHQLLIRNAEDQRRRYRRATRHGVGPDVSLLELPRGTLSHLMTAAGEAENQVIRAEDTEQLLRALDSLPKHYRKVIELHDLEGHSDEDIARRMSVSPNAIRCIRRRAMRLMRENLQELDQLPL
jgi:RNA polymerase sigma-70 factor (ECF subfamily)